MHQCVQRKIVGICLCKDEEHFVAWSICNILDFCDRIIVMDNFSSDRTREIVTAIAKKHPHVDILDVDSPNDTHKYIQEYMGSATWVFGVDGDEIYDPVGLKELRAQILSGELDNFWQIDGHMLHVVAIDEEKVTATGFTQPAAPAWTKLINLASIESWNPRKTERLHRPTTIVFKAGYSQSSILELWKVKSWDQSVLRCLHLCFFPRTASERRRNTRTKMPLLTGRPNPMEVLRSSYRLYRLIERIRVLLNKQRAYRGDYKHRHYVKGEMKEFDVSTFRSPCHYREFDLSSLDAEVVLSETSAIHMQSLPPYRK